MPVMLVFAVLLLVASIAIDVYFYAALAGWSRVGPGAVLFTAGTLWAIYGVVAREDWVRRFVMMLAAFYLTGGVIWLSVLAMHDPRPNDDIWLLYTLIGHDSLSAFYLPWCMAHPSVARWFDPRP
jgi:hypothetical protein